VIPGLTRNAVVAASAGTGKTELLTSIYLGHCLGLHGTAAALSPTRIVATTFSRAAAREIRERLEKRLSGVAGADDAEHERRLGADLVALGRERGLSRAELSRRAERALDELPDASIDTLHNLCGRILREHGLELGIVPSFTILEEQRSLEDTEQAIDEVLSDALDGEGLLKLGAQQLLDASGGLDRLRGWMLGLLARLDDEGLDAGDLDRGNESRAAQRAQVNVYEVCRELASDPTSPRAPLARAVLDALATAETGLDGDRLSRAFSTLAAEKKGRNAPGSESLKLLLERTRGKSNAERARAIVRLIVEGPTLDARLEGVSLVISEIQRRLRERHVAQHSLGFGDLLRLTRDGLRDHPRVARAAGATERQAARLGLARRQPLDDPHHVGRGRAPRCVVGVVGGAVVLDDRRPPTGLIGRVLHPRRAEVHQRRPYLRDRRSPGRHRRPGDDQRARGDETTEHRATTPGPPITHGFRRYRSRRRDARVETGTTASGPAIRHRARRRGVLGPGAPTGRPRRCRRRG